MTNLTTASLTFFSPPPHSSAAASLSLMTDFSVSDLPLLPQLHRRSSAGPPSAESDISEPVALDCRSEGRPTPLIYWLKEGRPEPLGPGGRHTLGTNGSLVLSRPRPW